MALWSMKWLVLWSLWAGRLVRQPTTTLQLSNGLVRGVIAPDGSHAQYLGIPYATFRGRFQSPGSEPIFGHVFDAVNENVRCKQGMTTFWVTGTLDCLTLNVYTPLNTKISSKLPVMVFIHGGAYFEGSNSYMIYGPNYLMDKGVILITINYRLNIQGFICLGIKEAPGNAAMKDQVAALRWIQKNVRKFGGDPDNVTLFGESAGGASVSYHLLSPMSKGLFHKAIIQSGSSLATWAYQYRPVFLASLLAKAMLYESQDPHDLYKYFMTKTDDELILTRVPRKGGNIITSEILYVPCSEKAIDGEEAFLTELPFDILSKGNYSKVPMIIGLNKEEGLLIFSMDNDTMIPLIKFEKSLPKYLEISSEKDRLEIAKELKRLYLEGKEISNDATIQLSRWLGDQCIDHPILEETELHLRMNENPIYNYFFQYDGKRNVPKMILPSHLRKVEGATHADELFYLFSQSFLSTLFEGKIIESMTTMWTNFAKYSDPTPDFTKPPVKWHRTNTTLPTSLVIDTEFDTIPLWHNERVKYLRELYSKYRRKR